MSNYLFEIMSGDYEGEEFFAVANNKDEAYKIARDVAGKEKFVVMDATQTKRPNVWVTIPTKKMGEIFSHFYI